MCDYKEIFESVFDGLNNAGLKSALRNERMPFEYCEKALNTRKLDWNCKLAIALRSDCSDEMLVKLCRNMCYKFTEGLLSKYEKRFNRHIPDEAISELMRKKENYQLVVQYWHLSDNIKKKMLKRFLIHKEKYDYFLGNQFIDFLNCQLTIPQECFEEIDMMMEKYVKKQFPSSYCKLNTFVLKFLRIPFDESTIDEFFRTQAHRSTLYFQIASNPSISDYVIMRLMAQAPEEIIGNVKEILDRNEEKREEYRKRNGNA